MREQVQALHEQLSELEEQNARLQLQAQQRPSISPVVASFNPSLRDLPHSYLAPAQQGVLCFFTGRAEQPPHLSLASLLCLLLVRQILPRGVLWGVTCCLYDPIHAGTCCADACSLAQRTG